MSEEVNKEIFAAYAVRLLIVATSLSSSMAISATVFAVFVYVATPDVISVSVIDHFSNTTSRTAQKSDFLLPPLISSWLYCATFAYVLIRVSPKLLQSSLQKSVSAKAGRSVLFGLCFGLLLLQDVKTVEIIKNCVTILALQKTGQPLQRN